jgi:sugar phosphate isomerase/epimerase
MAKDDVVTANIRVGFSMHPRWASGAELAGFLSPLQAAGLSVLEFELDENLDMWQEFAPLMSAVRNLGLHLSFHAPFRSPYSLAGFAGPRRVDIENMHRPMLDIASDWAQRDGKTKTVVIHAATAHKPADPDGLTADTLSFLAWALETYPGLMFALENDLPAAANQVKVGVRREDVLKIIHALQHPRLRVCWDMGHDHLNRSPEVPEPEWLAQVVHVHLHDVNELGVDHYPLVFGRVPFQPWLQALKRVGMHGTVVLELKGNQLKDWQPESIQKALVDSLHRITEEVQ